MYPGCVGRSVYPGGVYLHIPGVYYTQGVLCSPPAIPRVYYAHPRYIQGIPGGVLPGYIPGCTTRVYYQGILHPTMLGVHLPTMLGVHAFLPSWVSSYCTVLGILPTVPCWVYLLLFPGWVNLLLFPGWLTLIMPD